MKDDAPVKIMLYDVSYEVDLKDCHINAAPLTGAVLNRDNGEFQKFLKSITQGTEASKWIEKSKRGRGDMKALRKHYYAYYEGERHMNITKADLKELYFKRQDILPLKKYVNSLKEAYNNLE